MEGKMAGKIWTPIALIIGMSGLIMYLLSFPIAEGVGDETVWIKIFKELGIALLISAIVALTLDRLVHESLLSKVNNALEVIKNSSDALKGAVEMGIEDIFARRNPHGRNRWKEKVKNAIEEQFSKQSGEILIACVAAPDFFIIGNDICDIFWKYTHQEKNNCTLKVLLLCPDSAWTDLRAKLEPQHPLLEDIISSAKCLYNLKKYLNANNRVQFRCYDFPPIVFLVITDTLIFIEAYPMMKVENGEGSIGGRTPMLLVRKDTETYKRWKAHFQYIWDNQSNDYVDHHRKGRSRHELAA